MYKDERFLEMVREVILYDTEHFYEYYKGLILRIIEDRNDPNKIDVDTIQRRNKMSQDLEK